MTTSRPDSPQRGVKEALTLLVKSKTHGKAVWHTTFESQRDHAVPRDTHTQCVEDWAPRLTQQSQDLLDTRGESGRLVRC